jgi:hypothetical protein
MFAMESSSPYFIVPQGNPMKWETQRISAIPLFESTMELLA